MLEQYFNFKDLSVEVLQSNYEEIKTKISNTLDTIVSSNEDRTFDNTIRPYIQVTTDLEPKIHAFGYCSSYHPQKDIRDTGSELEGELKKYFIDVGQRKDYYDACNTYLNGNYPLEKDTLTYEENRYFTQLIRDFRRDGLHLSDQSFVEMKKNLADLETAFDKNLNEENTSFIYSKEQLAGLPESFFTDERKVEGSTDLYKVTLKYPDTIPISKYCLNEEVRKEMYLAFNNRCSLTNTPLFEKAVNLRNEIAKKLGYNTFADFKTEVRIVKTGQNALDFLNNLNTLVTPLYEKEMVELLAFAKAYEKNPLLKDKLDLWDYGFYSRCYEEEVYQVDLEEIKKYFPMNTVRAGLFKIYQELFSLTFEEVVTDNKWHPDVQLFKVTDTKSNDILGFFYTDLYPRENKFSHACASQLMASCQSDNVKDRRPNIVSLICNFDKGGDLTFDEVVTLFHEFGHCIAFICGKPQLSSFCGFGVETDFVECPSQCLEHFCYSNEVLALLSRHVDTGEPLPNDLIKKIKDSKNVLTGYFHKRQLVFGLFDLTAHTMTNTDNFDAITLWNDVEEKVLGVRPTVSVSKVASFGHLMGGYEASYYSYLRAATYATNIFYKCFKDCPMSVEAGSNYRKKLLEPGSTKDGLDLLRDLLGEEPNDIYYLMDIGLNLSR
ncbi:MAG: hypothetical protein Barrevirus12_8 [Barrevirus sp.]|uniref:Peptidase M3A/M3B catalytic domain-containing protein n=1 Tax=Barrevirus sp. TaxID=2487763 RepID=A0A3G4ZUK6_9VIRU|nr:MAG: hypothetical protein Barrevirus12_8 [Barrevirus sp.]